MNDLIPLENPQPSALFVPGGLESILVRIETDARSLVPDITTVKGRSAVSSLAAKVAKAKTYLDGLGKDYTADLKRQTGAVDAERKAMRDRLDALKAEVRRPLDEWEQEESDRVFRIQSRIASSFQSFPSGVTSEQAAVWIADVEDIAVDESFAELQAKAQAAKEACLYRLTQARDAALYREAEAARIAAETEAASAKSQQEREERIAREAAERATREAQAQARSKAAKAEQERIAAARKQADVIARAQAEKSAAVRAQALAEQRAKDAEDRAQRAAKEAIQRAEFLRIEEERKQKEVDAKRAADSAHRERIHAEIVDDLESQSLRGSMDWESICIVKAISSGRIRHLRIEY